MMLNTTRAASLTQALRSLSLNSPVLAAAASSAGVKGGKRRKGAVGRKSVIDSDLLPKVPPNAFILYVKDNKERLMDNIMPHQQKEYAAQMTKRASEEWSQVSNAKKEVYLKEANQQMAKYRQEVVNINVDDIKHSVQQRQKAIGKLKGEMSKLVSDRPKVNLNGFTLYIGEQGLSMKDAQVLWDKISESEKSLYNAKAKQYKAEMSKKMEAWERKVAADGRQEIIETIKSKLKVLRRI